MGDYAKKPSGYRRGRCLEFERICREEQEAGETVVVFKPCAGSFPCFVDIYVLTGINPPCDHCATALDDHRTAQGYLKIGEFWHTDRLTKDQQAEIDQLIKRRICAAS